MLRPDVAVQQLDDACAEGSIRRHTLTSEDELAWFTDLRERTPSLGSGKAATLAACLANGWVFASDDRRARQLAASLRAEPEVRVSGTLGVLVGAIERGAIDGLEGQRLLEQMIEAGYRSPITRLSDLTGGGQTTTAAPTTPAE